MKYVTEAGACKTAAVLTTERSPTDLETHEKVKHYKTKLGENEAKKSMCFMMNYIFRINPPVNFQDRTMKGFLLNLST